MFLQSLADGDNIRQLVSIGGSQTELEGRTWNIVKLEEVFFSKTFRDHCGSVFLMSPFRRTKNFDQLV
jgi:adenylylsulfate kinase-like enzyme